MMCASSLSAYYAAWPNWNLFAAPPKNKQRQRQQYEIKRRQHALAAREMEHDRQNLQHGAPQGGQHGKAGLDARERWKEYADTAGEIDHRDETNERGGKLAGPGYHFRQVGDGCRKFHESNRDEQDGNQDLSDPQHDIECDAAAR